MSEFIGSVVAGFSASGNSASAAKNLQTGVTSITGSNTNFINQLQVSSVNINGRSYSASNSTSSNGSDEGTNAGLIAGLTVGLVAAAALIAVISVVGYKQYQEQKGRRLLKVTDEECSYSNELNEDTTSPSNSVENVSQMPKHTSVSSSGLTTVNTNEHRTPLSSNTNGQRISSATLSVTKLDCITVDKVIPDVELINFD